MKTRQKIPTAKAETDDPYPRTSFAWGQVIEDVLTIDDPVAEAKRLQEDLEIGEGGLEYAIIIVRLDRAAANLYAAKRLHRAAKIEDERFTAECEERLEILRTQARKELEELRSDGKIKGVITKQQIEDQIIANWPREYATIRQRISKMHGTTQALEGLVDAWNHRNSALNKMLERAALGRVVSGGGR